jgi:hypothetical protein
MNHFARRVASVGVVLAAFSLLACMTQEQKAKKAIEDYKAEVSGQFANDSGATLFIAPIRARMVTDEALYIERHAGSGVLVRIANIFVTKKQEIKLQALTFTSEGQWRNLRENPELLTSLLPKDVRPAGTCEITASEDKNSVTFSCGGSAPEVYNRM